MLRFGVLALTWLVVGAGSAGAQTTTPQPPPASNETTQVDSTKMGVDLSRIRRELAVTESEAAQDGPLKFSFSVQVVGVAPRINLLSGFSLQGPLKYGAPTHQEFLDVVTPKYFRTPTVNMLGLAVLAAQKLSDYSQKKGCEAEIEEYRRQVMQGIAVAAPRCSQ